MLLAITHPSQNKESMSFATTKDNPSTMLVGNFDLIMS
jgi:hypothetical protein